MMDIGGFIPIALGVVMFLASPYIRRQRISYFKRALEREQQVPPRQWNRFKASKINWLQNQLNLWEESVGIVLWRLFAVGVIMLGIGLLFRLPQQ
jgi:hypothetical protein